MNFNGKYIFGFVLSDLDKKKEKELGCQQTHQAH
jgi:hypothetical protein